MSSGQSIRKEKMSQLSFLVGEWIGTSKSFKNGKLEKEIAAFEKIEYQLDNHILTVDLNSESLQLHTVIYYDEEDKTYYYNPFYKTGAAKYKAEFDGKKLIVKPSAKKRFVFILDKQGNFTEYGEILTNGKWVKYFEDVFKRS